MELSDIGLTDLSGDRYYEYLFNIAPDLDISILECVEVIISRTNWLNSTFLLLNF
jgi:hypothetical protein